MAKSIKVESIVLDPAAMNVDTLEGYASRGWVYFSNQQYEKAVDDFRHVVGAKKNDIDSWYGLGLSLKAAGSMGEAVEAFYTALGLISTLEDKQRVNVLERLVKGQINQIKTGDWNLEKEVWKRS